MYNVHDVIDWLLSHEAMTPKKLQKMLYYCYAWVLTLCNDDIDCLDNKLFNDEFQAWVHGPVVYSVYKDYQSYGFNDIPKLSQPAKVRFSPEILGILNQVWNVYGKYDAGQLENLTHKEDPWKNAREGLSPLEKTSNPISDKDIYSYYIKKAR